MEIKIIQLEKRYSIKNVFDKININIQSNPNSWLLGKNGTGKTT